jgi:DNA-binding response OmpR family regulator
MEATPTKSKALIIDDDPSLRRLAQAVFERNGFEVTVAVDGAEGVRQAFKNPPHVIVLDIMMEGLNGFEVCKMLRSNSNLQRTAIVITSGKSYKPDIDKALELGADTYIVKPYSPKELFDIATEHMNKRASQP